MPYTPTAGPLPGERWQPERDDDLGQFADDHCQHCARDRSYRDDVPIEDCREDELCPIIAAAFAGAAVEWRRLADGALICTAHVRPGDPIPPRRCELTIDWCDQPTTT